VVTVAEVGEVAVTVPGTPPKVMPATPTVSRPVPETTTDSPPWTLPEDGVTPVIVAAPGAM
jgi:hypothetical protein